MCAFSINQQRFWINHAQSASVETNPMRASKEWNSIHITSGSSVFGGCGFKLGVVVLKKSEVAEMIRFYQP